MKGYTVPINPEEALRLYELLEKVIWESATQKERLEFQEFCIGRVRSMLVLRKERFKTLLRQLKGAGVSLVFSDFK